MPCPAMPSRNRPFRCGPRLRKIGPGIILAGSIVGSGELLLTTSLGANHGFAFLWLILFSCVIKVFVQTELGRYAISSGKPTLGAINELPGPRLGAHWIVWCWLFMMLTTIFQLGAMTGTVGQSLNLAFPNVAVSVAHSWIILADVGGCDSHTSGDSVGGADVPDRDRVALERELPTHRIDHDGPCRRPDVHHVDGHLCTAGDEVSDSVVRGGGRDDVHASGRGNRRRVRRVWDHRRRGLGTFLLSVLVPGEGLCPLRRPLRTGRGVGTTCSRLDSRHASGCLGEHDRLHDLDAGVLLHGSHGAAPAEARPEGDRDDQDALANV